MSKVLLAGIVGGIGGLTRGVVGMMKAMALERNVNWRYWILTACISVVIGVFTGLIFNYDLRLSALSGYAGTDVVEGIYKSFKVEKVIAVEKTA